MKKLITYSLRVAMTLLALVMVFTAQNARAEYNYDGYGWYDGSMTIGGVTTDLTSWSTSGITPTDLGILTDMTITSITFSVWDDADNRGAVYMGFNIWDENGNLVGTVSDNNFSLGAANRIDGSTHDYTITWSGTKDLAAAVGLTLLPGKTYYIDMWAVSYRRTSDGTDAEWYSGDSGSNYHAKMVYAPTTCDVTANLANGAYWATFYSNGANYQAPEGTEVFGVQLAGTTLTMLPIADRIVKSGEGVVLKQATASSDATTTITLTKTDSESASSYDNNSLEGTTDVKTPGDNNYYVLSNGANGVGFYKLSNEGSIGVNKAYLTYSAGAREFFGFDEATGINATLKDKGETINEKYYDLQGRRVAQPTKGLYIVNGKKVIK